MRQFSPKAQAYIALVILSGALAIGVAWHLDRAQWMREFSSLLLLLHPHREVRLPSAGGEANLHNGSGLFELLIGCLLAALAARIKVVLFTHQGRQGERYKMSMSLAFVPSFIVIYTLGPLAGVIAGICTTPFSFSGKKKTPLYRAAFNGSSGVLCALAAALVLKTPGFAPAHWDPFGGAETGSTLMPLLGILLATIAYYLLNTVLVVGAISLTTGEKPLAMWKQLLWTGPGYFAGASCAAIILALLPLAQQARTHHFAILALILVSFPIPTVIYWLYKYHAQLDQEKQARIEVLNRSQEELQQINTELVNSKEDLQQINVALNHSKENLQQLFTSTVESLALAIDAKDRYTNQHIQRVKGIAVAIAQEMGLIGDDLKAVETGALLHDIGKIAVPEHILTKPGRLSDEEFEKIKAHPEMGARILEPVQFPFPVMPIVRHHHERWDGTGYPDGLAGETIPLGGRILAVADVYDALTSDRSYRRGWTHERAVTHIQENAGSHFDPFIVKAFIAVVEKRPDIFDVRSPLLAQNGLAGTKDSVHDAVASGGSSFEHRALYEVSQALSTTTTLNEMLTILAEKARQLFEASACVVLLAEDYIDAPLSPQGSHPPRPSLRVKRAVGSHERPFHNGYTLFGVGATGLAASTGQAATAVFDPEDILTDDSPGGSFADDPLQSVMVAPLTNDQVVIGTVNVYQNRPHAFDGEALRVLEAIAQQAARAFCKAIEFDRTLESSLTDALTGLNNARYLNQFLDRELERVRLEKQPMSVLVLDLDNFKPVNDRYGHPWGNEVLRDVGRLFQGALRSGDLVARYAGDEFVVVLPNTNCAEAYRVIDEIRATLRSYDARPAHAVQELANRIEVSVGVATFPKDGHDRASLISAADREMFRDKKQRKGKGIAAEELVTRSMKRVV